LAVGGTATTGTDSLPCTVELGTAGTAEDACGVGRDIVDGCGGAELGESSDLLVAVVIGCCAVELGEFSLAGSIENTGGTSEFVMVTTVSLSGSAVLAGTLLEERS